MQQCTGSAFKKENTVKKWVTATFWKRLVVALVFLAAFGGALFYANTGWEGYTITDSTGVEFETALVREVLEDKSVIDDMGIRRGSMELRLELLTGRYAGDIVDVTNYFSAIYNVYVTAGQKVIVRVSTADVNIYMVSIYNYDRTMYLIAFVVLFALALIVIGGMQGVRAFLGLIFTFVSVVYLLVPLTLRGWPSVPLTLALVAVTSIVSFYLLGGWQPKTVGAALGCLCGVGFAALLGAIASRLVHITAYQMDEAEALMLAQSENGLQMQGLFLSGILITALGAVMDIAMSVASAMDELKQKRPDIPRWELFRSGMKVGRDATGTMANTLVLAVAGTSLNMMILIYSYRVTAVQLLNTDFIAIEVVRGLAGSMGIILAVPCVAIITAWLLTPAKEK